MVKVTDFMDRIQSLIVISKTKLLIKIEGGTLASLEALNFLFFSKD